MSRKKMLIVPVLMLLALSLFAQDKGMPDKKIFTDNDWVEMLESTSEYEIMDEEGNADAVLVPDLQLVAHVFNASGSYLIIVPENAEEYRWTWDKKKGVMTILSKEDNSVLYTMTLTEWDQNHLVFTEDGGGFILRLEKY